MFFVASPFASIDTKSLRSPFSSRSCHRRVKYSRHSYSSACRASSLSTIPLSSSPVATSDQRVSLRRSSKGKSKSVANICVVNSMETRSTQSNCSPTGRSSSTCWVRDRMVSSISLRLAGATEPCTVLRCSSCTGGSMAMNIGSGKSSSGSRMVIAGSEEKSCQLPSISIMSL